MLGVLRALVVSAAALCVLVAAVCIHFQGFHFASDGIFVAVFAICLLAADRTYDWLSKKTRSRVAAYSSAASVLMVCVFILAELMVRLNFDNRASIYSWMTGFGIVTTVAWIAFDLLLRGRLDRSETYSCRAGGCSRTRFAMGGFRCSDSESAGYYARRLRIDGASFEGVFSGGRCGWNAS